MRSHRLYANLATEEIVAEATTPEQDAAVAAEPVVEPGADGLEASLVEIQGDMEEVASDDAAVETAAEVSEEMEVAVESLRVAAQNGGIDRFGAQLLQNQMDSWNKRLGSKDAVKRISTEAFGNIQGRAGTTTLSVEEVEKANTGVWQKIVAMWEKMVNFIVGLWNKFFDGATRLGDRAKKVAAVKVDGEPSSKTFQNAGLAKALHINGVVNAVEAAKDVAGFGAFLTPSAEGAIKVAEDVMKAIDAKNAEGITAAFKHINVTGYAKVADPASVGMSSPGDGVELYKSEALPGNRAFITFFPKEGATPDQVAKAGIKLGMFDASKKVNDKLEMNVLGGSDIAAVAKSMEEASKAILNYKSVQKKAEGEAKKMIAAAKKYTKEGGVAGSDKSAKGSMNLLVQSGPAQVKFMLETGAAVLQYAEQSIKLYGKAAPAKDAPAAPAAAAA